LLGPPRRARYLLDQLETELGATPQKALVSRSFGGTLTNRIICSSCGHQSPTKVRPFNAGVVHRPKDRGVSLSSTSIRALQEAFTDLALPFDTADEAAPTDLAAMLRSFLRAELLEGSNRYACPRCDALRDARKVE
jgi:ubiquitin C-terminal hydrolase